MKLVIFSPTTGFVNSQHGITNDPRFADHFSGKLMNSQADPDCFGPEHFVEDATYVDPSQYSHLSMPQMLEKLWDAIEGAIDGERIAKEISSLIDLKITYNEDSIWYCNGEMLTAEDLKHKILALKKPSHYISYKYNSISMHRSWVASGDGFYYKENRFPVEKPNKPIADQLTLFKQQIGELTSKATNIANIQLNDSDYKLAIVQAIASVQHLVSLTTLDDIKS